MDFYKKGIIVDTSCPIVDKITEMKQHINKIKKGQERFYTRGITNIKEGGFWQTLADISIALPTIDGVYSIYESGKIIRNVVATTDFFG